MMDSIFNFIGAYHPEFFQDIILLAAVAFAASKITTFYLKTVKLHEDMPAMRTTLARIDKGFALLNSVLLEKTVISRSCYSQEASPRAINTLGEQLLRESGAREVFETKKFDLLRELERMPIDSRLALEREAMNLMLAHRDDEDCRPLQDFAFEHPTFNGKPLTYADILFVIALKLRDFYRTRHAYL